MILDRSDSRSMACAGTAIRLGKRRRHRGFTPAIDLWLARPGTSDHMR